MGVLSGTRELELARQQEGTALTPGGRCLPALGTSHSGEKTVFGRAPFPTQPSRRDGRPTPPPGGETQRSPRSLALPLASTEKLFNQTQPLSKRPAFSHLATNRAHRACESPPAGFAEKTPAFKCRAARPRAAADTAPVCCTASATPGTSGRRRFRRGVAVPTTWTSTTSGSSRSISTAVRTVFSCVASRNRSRKTTAELCQEKPNPRVPSGTSRRPGWWRLARPLRVAISPFAAQLPGAPSEKLLRHTVIDRALGEILLEQLS